MDQFNLSKITPRYILNTRRFLTLSVAIGLVACLVVILGIIPQIQAMLEVQNQTAVESRKLAALEQKARQLEQILTPELLGQIDTVNVLLPSRKPLLELLASLNQVSNQTQVSVTGIELSPGSIATDSSTPAGSAAPSSKQNRGKSSSASNSLTVKLLVEGQLSQLNQFFNSMESTAPLVTITSLSLSPQNKIALSSDVVPGLFEDPGSQRYEAALEISAAYFTQSIAAAIDSALPTLSQSQQEIIQELASFTVKPLQDQPTIQGGGLQDLFGVEQPTIEVTN
jgi:hypothetical protein